MTALTFPYVEFPSETFGVTLRPIIALELHSERFDTWILVDRFLADTGADVSIVPLPLGRFLVGDETTGIFTTIGGLSPDIGVPAYLHTLQCRLGEEIFTMPVAIIQNESAPTILGRRDALDRFVVRFVSGIEVIIEQ